MPISRSEARRYFAAKALIRWSTLPAYVAHRVWQGSPVTVLSLKTTSGSRKTVVLADSHAQISELDPKDREHLEALSVPTRIADQTQPYTGGRNR